MGGRFFHILAAVSLMVTIVPVHTFLDIDGILEFPKKVIIETIFKCTPCIPIFPMMLNMITRDPTTADLSLILSTGTPTETTPFKLSEPVKQLLDFVKFKKNVGITIIIHGWLSSQENTKQIIAALIAENVETNILSLNIGNFFYVPYYQAIKNVRKIGTLLGERLNQYYVEGGFRGTIHLIGHSLGAQVSGFAAKKYKYLGGGRLISRITGLDPARPCFDTMGCDQRLCKTDATFIDVIHTGAGDIGSVEQTGHVNFWPNGGTDQPVSATFLESHERCWKYYVESIYFPKNFPAVKCDKWENFQKGACSNGLKVYMGYFLPATTPEGIYYLRTNGASNFGLREQGIQRENYPPSPPWTNIFG